MTAESEKFHPFGALGEGIEPPERLNDPFGCNPHPLCRIAAEALMRHLESHPEWSGELACGKMFGVLVVRGRRGESGFLAAFSGNLHGSNNHPYFVPPVYDMLAPDGFFRRGEAEISAINRRIDDLTSGEELKNARLKAERAAVEAVEEVGRFRLRAAEARRERGLRRAAGEDAEILDNESRREKSELRRLKESSVRRTAEARAALEALLREIEELKSERKRRSEQLQRELFMHFEAVDSQGRKENLLSIFDRSVHSLPPAGTGECAAPKLFQYAFLNGYTPLSIAEFWYGASPKGEVRRHGSFYPACRGKCKPLLEYMLRGIDMEKAAAEEFPSEPEIVYEDSELTVVSKPAGMLSVEGKIERPSVEAWAKLRFGADAARVVNRLDMDVSGLMIVAKSPESYRRLQEQFLRRTVKKRYIALVEGAAAADEGRIEIPLRPDPFDRPRQVADPVHGKRAVTLFRVKERRQSQTLVELEPVTGRTHQLRVHAASAEGLDSPIVGDTLYGARPARRLCLHSEYLEFDSPRTGERLRFSAPLPPEEAF